MRCYSTFGTSDFYDLKIISKYIKRRYIVHSLVQYMKRVDWFRFRVHSWRCEWVKPINYHDGYLVSPLAYQSISIDYVLFLNGVYTQQIQGRTLTYTSTNRANMRRWPDVSLLLAHRLRRRPNSKPTLGLRLMFAGTGPLVKTVTIMLDQHYRRCNSTERALR